jgi:XTP/dITP diphosphohydrolase
MMPSCPISLTLATQNQHKLEEASAFLASFEGSNLLFQLSPSPSQLEIEETGQTFLENARLKALATPPATQNGYVLGDDSGLIIPALSGRENLTEFPGIQSNRWLSVEKRNALLEVTHPDEVSTRDKNDAIRILMRGESHREAYYVCALCLVQNGQILWEGEGRMSLWVIPDDQTPAGSGGFGYDPIMLPMIEGQVQNTTVEALPVSALSMTEKNRLSHRGQALGKLVQYFQNF